MKHLLIILALQGVCLGSLDKLTKAVEQVESGGKVEALGDYKGGVARAVGPMQIWKIYVDDVNRIQKKVKYTYADRKNRKKSYEMFKIYVNHYASKKRLKRTPTDEDRARCHNGGGNGYKKQSTVKYWNRVKAKLKGK